MEIRIDNLTHIQTLELIRLHVEQMYAHFPSALVFALNVDHLKASDSRFWPEARGPCRSQVREQTAAKSCMRGMRTAEHMDARGC